MLLIQKIFDRTFLLALALLFFATQANAQESPLCDENGCVAAVAPAEYSGRAAWKLTDGKTEAIVVPSLGRLMSFKRVGGQNWLWENQAAAKTSGNNWKNWGGDKTWLAPQKRWKELGSKTGWPPPIEWDGAPFESQILSGGKLKIWGPVSSSTGLRISRVFYHDANGDFVVEQTVSKTQGAPVEASIWCVAQVASADLSAVFLPRFEGSKYANGFRWLQGKTNAEISSAPRAISSTLLKVAAADAAYKIGTDAPRAALAAMRGDWALVLRSQHSSGIYPDGETSISGLPVEFYNSGDTKSGYVELELLSPLLQFRNGERQTHIVRWSVQQLPSADAMDAKVHAVIEKSLD